MLENTLGQRLLLASPVRGEVAAHNNRIVTAPADALSGVWMLEVDPFLHDGDTETDWDALQRTP
jgi:hypothetical protein